MKKIRVVLPGLLVSLLVAIFAQIVAKFLPNLGAATIAILLGIVLGNTILKQPILQAGTKFSESKLLEYSVMLLGATITVQTITHIGWHGVIFIVFQMAITVIGAIFIGRKLGFGEGVTLMMAGGNAVCGSSAIASISPVIEADEDDKGMVITLVNLLGTILMLTLPFIGILFYGHNFVLKGALIGGTLQSVGQVVASASMINQATVQFATLFKIMRIMMLVFVVFIFGRMHQKQLQAQVETDAIISGNASPKSKGKWLPWYVAGFLIFCGINSLATLPNFVSYGAHSLSSWFEIIALAAIGLRLNVAAFLKAGKKFALYGFGVGTIQVVAALILIGLLFHA
ncbi:putative sulfate exporter family transporter [Lactobacillus sp. CC-MHH1034]|uniref:YeiH family protein n=1 Tax=Agrilactobacillus fermenti TaxID=2586909 RepID=UPI001E441BEB|nr:putative sulfate exporter family transporter [Agrilactobacillus fermenti]MCD2256004.1 putative sulfate exporter family transporter [Agrilactobacillus fermenti]